jgi:hypothetical protein
MSSLRQSTDNSGRRAVTGVRTADLSFGMVRGEPVCGGGAVRRG